MDVEFLYTEVCQDADAAWLALCTILDELPLDATVRRIRVNSIEEAARLGFSGSPTIRFNGMDVQGPPAGEPPGLGCRKFFHHDGQTRGWPEVETIRSALHLAAGGGMFCCDV